MRVYHQETCCYRARCWSVCSYFVDVFVGMQSAQSRLWAGGQVRLAATYRHVCHRGDATKSSLSARSRHPQMAPSKRAAALRHADRWTDRSAARRDERRRLPLASAARRRTNGPSGETSSRRRCRRAVPSARRPARRGGTQLLAKSEKERFDKLDQSDEKYFAYRLDNTKRR